MTPRSNVAGADPKISTDHEAMIDPCLTTVNRTAPPTRLVSESAIFSSGSFRRGSYSPIHHGRLVSQKGRPPATRLERGTRRIWDELVDSILHLSLRSWPSLRGPVPAQRSRRFREWFDDDREEWRGGPATCLINYYNICTGWVWVWSGFADGDRIGVNFSNCCGGGFIGRAHRDPNLHRDERSVRLRLHRNARRVRRGRPGLPDGILAGDAVLPSDEPLAHVDYSAAPISLPESFVMLYTNAQDAIPNPAAIGSDHPAAGPTGPQACGTCFQANRTNHSFVYGTAAITALPRLDVQRRDLRRAADVGREDELHPHRRRCRLRGVRSRICITRGRHRARNARRPKTTKGSRKRDPFFMLATIGAARRGRSGRSPLTSVRSSAPPA